MNVSTSTVGLRRRKGNTQNIDDEENAAELKLGSEFQVQQYDHDGNKQELMALNLSEARILIREALKERSRALNPNSYEDDENLGEIDDDTLARNASAPNANEVLRKTLEYLSQFARFRDEPTTEAVEQILKNKDLNLHPFEVAQLGSLDCGDVEEAVTLVPSLHVKQKNIDLERIIDELNKLASPYS